jgi:arsenate reductase
MDYIITVCDKAVGEICPIWPGQPISAYWGFEDPNAVGGSNEVKRRAFAKTFRHIMNRVQVFVNLPIALLEKSAIKHEVDKIGQLLDE